MLKAIFKLEQEITTATGSGLIANDMFNRRVWVGLANDHYGRLTLGRQFYITNKMLMPLSNAYQTGVYPLYHPVNLDNYTSFDNEPIAPNGSFVARPMQIIAGSVTYVLTSRGSIGDQNRSFSA